MASTQQMSSPAFPNSIPKSVFGNLVKELVADRTEEVISGYASRVSSDAVKLLQSMSEDYITDIFEATETPDNKILTVESFQGARIGHALVELKRLHAVPEGEKTILDYESHDDLF